MTRDDLDLIPLRWRPRGTCVLLWRVADGAWIPIGSVAQAPKPHQHLWWLSIADQCRTFATLNDLLDRVIGESTSGLARHFEMRRGVYADRIKR